MTDAKTFSRIVCILILSICFAGSARAGDERKSSTGSHPAASGSRSSGQNSSSPHTPAGMLALPASPDDVMDELEGLEGSQVESFRAMLKNSQEIQKAYEQAAGRSGITQLTNADLLGDVPSGAPSSAQFSELYGNAMKMANQARALAAQRQSQMLREIARMEMGGMEEYGRNSAGENAYRESPYSPRYNPAETKLSPMGSRHRSSGRRR